MSNKYQINKYEASPHFKNDKINICPSTSQANIIKCKTEPNYEDEKSIIVISDEEKTPVKAKSERPNLTETALYKKHLSSYLKQGFSFTKSKKFAQLNCMLKNTSTNISGEPTIPQDIDFNSVNLKDIGRIKLSGSARRRRAILLRKGFSMKEATVYSHNKIRWCKNQGRKPGASKEYIERMREKYPSRTSLMRAARKSEDSDEDRESPVTFDTVPVNTLSTETKNIGLLPSEYPSICWTTTQFEILQQCILNEIRKLPANSDKPNFDGCIFKYGFITLIYDNKDVSTEKWIKSAVPTLKPWPNFSVRIVEEENIPCSQIFTAWFPESNDEGNKTILTQIEKRNKGLSTKKWEVLFRNENGINTELILDIDPISVKNLDQLNYEINYRSYKVCFKRTNDNSNYGFQTENTSGAFNTSKCNNVTANFKTNQEEGNILCPQIFTAWFPESNDQDNESILTEIKKRNRGLRTNKWKVLFRNENGINTELTLAMDPISLRNLDRFNYEINYRSYKVCFKRTNDNSNYGFQTENTSGAFNTTKYNNITANFKTNQKGNIPCSRIFTAWFPESNDEDNESILTEIKERNRGLRTNIWEVLFRNENGINTELTLAMDPISLRNLERFNYEINYRSYKVCFKRTNDNTNYGFQTDNTSGAFNTTKCNNVTANFKTNQEEGNIPCQQIFAAWFPESNDVDNKSILKEIKKRNRGLRINKWEVLFRNENGINTELTLAIDPISLRNLDKDNYEINYRSYKVCFKRKHDNINYGFQTENTSGAFNTTKYNNITTNFETRQDDTSSSFNSQNQQQRLEDDWLMSRNRFTYDNMNFDSSNFDMQKGHQNEQYHRKQNFSENEHLRCEKRFINNMDSLAFGYSATPQQHSENKKFRRDERCTDDDESSDFMYSMNQQQNMQQQNMQQQNMQQQNMQQQNMQQQSSENKSYIRVRKNVFDDENFDSRSSSQQERQQLPYENKWSMDAKNSFNSNGNFFSNCSRSQGQQNEIGHISDTERPNSIMQQQYYEGKRFESNWPVSAETHMNDSRNSNSRFSFEKQCQERCSENQYQRFENNSFVDVERSLNDDGNSNSIRQKRQPHQQHHQQQHHVQQNYETNWSERERIPENKNESQQYRQQQEFSQNEWCNRERGHINDQQQNYEMKWSEREKSSENKNESQQYRQQQEFLQNQWRNRERSPINDQEQNYETKWSERERSPENKNESRLQYRQQQEFLQNQWCNRERSPINNQQQNYEIKWSERERSPENKNKSRQQYRQQQEFLQNRERSIINDRAKSNERYSMTQQRDEHGSEYEWPLKLDRNRDANKNSNTRFSTIQGQNQQRLENEYVADQNLKSDGKGCVNKYSDIFERRRPKDSTNYCSPQENYRNDWSTDLDRDSNYWRTESNYKGSDMSQQNYSPNNNDKNMSDGLIRWPQWHISQ
ncbi:putative uncharacterized protein DDB_G0282133 [Teleopsis dalmanni]|uniref:putative uncharacterized protein DDB_G0282133 n=1 Tax=Teleopsis dalmanni TaxID=139649 RepID=UPI0018CDDB1D|nr:putative uncharacterized protein DDB_G0282133 [Teleopsis dalmanni]XP_037945271.1 putative uncharacterized protein DDB_G0282133 [Teleopsis dalmanni]